MTGRWFRFYDSVVDDPKVQRLPDQAFRAWVNLMCVASKNDGKISTDLQNVAFALRVNLNKARDLLQVLQSAGLIERFETGWEPHNWNARQFKSDVSTDRVKRFRERSTKQDETVSETPPDTEQSRAEQIIEESPPLRVVEIPKKIPPKVSFPAFYEAYPKHVAKGAALKAYIRACSRASPEVLLAGAQRYAASRAREDPQFTQNPATWLNADCWLDEDGKTKIMLDPETAAAVKDRSDQLMRRGKYAETFKDVA